MKSLPRSKFKKNKGRIVKEWKLWEVSSLTKWPANELAGTHAVKTMEDMKNLTYQAAVSIYIDRYWNRIIGNEIKNQSVALLIYDGAVNQGRGAMRSIVGESMRGLGSYIDNSEVFTNEGTSQLNSLNQEKLFLKIYNGRKLRYEGGQEAFVQGHLNRLSGIKFFKNKPSFNLAIVFIVLIVVLSILIYRL